MCRAGRSERCAAQASIQRSLGPCSTRVRCSNYCARHESKTVSGGRGAGGGDGGVAGHAVDRCRPRPRQPPPPPAKPTGLAVTAVGHDSVALSWDDPADSSVTGYVILRRDRDNQPAGAFSTVADDTGTSAAAFIDDSVQPQSRYVYRVRAISPAGVSARSGYVRAETSAAAPVPARPTGLAVTSVGHDSVTLGWDDPGDSSVTGYVILRRDRDNQPPGAFSTVADDTGTSAVAFVDDSVQPQSRYV